MHFNNCFRAFAGNLFEPLLVVDMDKDEIVYANPAAFNFFGLEGDIIKSTASDVIFDAKFKLFNLKDHLAKNDSWADTDITVIAKENQKISCNINATPLKGEGCNLASITIQNRATSELADLGQDVRKIAHDIRGALAAAQLMCERLSNHEDSQVRRAAELLTRSLNRVFQMCLQILQVGKAKAVEPQIVQFYISDLISDLNASITGQDANDFITLDACQEILIEADYDQIFRVLLNLSRNAKNAGASNITISGQNSDQGTEITLSDDGPGIPEETIPSLFKAKPLYTGQGTGLGLIITHEIVTNHKGKISLVKNDDEGAIFSIYLPREAQLQVQA